MIIGHKRQKEFLNKALKHDRLAHAYIFSGPSHIGKKALALEFAQTALCSQRNNVVACGQCPSCKMFKKAVHPDFLLIKPEESETQIHISKIEELIRFLSISRSFSEYKIVIIDHAHSLGKRAQNCLLKTLEEPRGNAILILVTEHPDILFPTICSRTQEIKFSTVPLKTIITFLEQQDVSTEEKKHLLRFNAGKPGRIINFLEMSGDMDVEKKQFKKLEKVLCSDLEIRFNYAKTLSTMPIKENLEIWLNYFRVKLLEKLDKGEETENIQRNLSLLMRVNFLIATTNVNRKLLLENLMLAI